MNFIITLVGVPAGLAITGGNLQTVMTATLAFWLAIFTLFLRRWPLSVVILSMLSVAAFHMAGLIGAGWVWPATAGLAAIARDGRLRTAAITAGCGLVYGFGWDGFVDLRHGIDWSLAHVGGETLWIAAVLAGATAQRNNLRWRAEMDRRLEQDSQRRRAEERVEIARDLHDVVSHTLAVVGVHLNVAMDAFDADPAEAKESLRLAQEVRGQAMTDLKSLVGVLRSPLPDLRRLDQLTEQVRAAGLEVSLNEFGDPADVPAPVAAAVVRVVQESLTNTVRHADARKAVVTLRYAPHSVVVDVQDDGVGATAGIPTDGHGISGMRERVAALGGALTAGPGKNGFTVRATIPITDA